ncbi:MAG: hypothetical protein R3F61_33865 [Myxococcota bacterium]
MGSKNEDLSNAMIALGAIGLGLAGFAALSEWEKRRQFREALEASLGQRGVGLVTAEVGRSASGGPSWHVTVNHPWNGLLSYHADFPSGADPYSADALDDLIGRLVYTMPPTRRGWG